MALERATPSLPTLQPSQVSLERIAWALRILVHNHGLNSAAVVAAGVPLKDLEPSSHSAKETSSTDASRNLASGRAGGHYTSHHHQHATTHPHHAGRAHAGEQHVGGTIRPSHHPSAASPPHAPPHQLPGPVLGSWAVLSQARPTAHAPPIPIPLGDPSTSTPPPMLVPTACTPPTTAFITAPMPKKQHASTHQSVPSPEITSASTAGKAKDTKVSTCATSTTATGSSGAAAISGGGGAGGDGGGAGGRGKARCKAKRGATSIKSSSGVDGESGTANSEMSDEVGANQGRSGGAGVGLTLWAQTKGKSSANQIG